MKKIFLFACMILACTLSSNAQTSQLELEEGATKLFNGKDLENWYTYIANRGKNVDPNGVFTVEDGVIHITGEEWGCITTDLEYENYKFTFRYKWGEKTWGPRINSARDSGLLFHSIGEDGASSNCWMNSIEVNVIEGRTGDFIVIGNGSDKFALTSKMRVEEGGYFFDPINGKTHTIVADGRLDWINVDKDWKDVKGFVGANDIENPHGEWNVLECVVIGDEIYVFLNGKFINYGSQIRPSKGKIQIQSEGAELFVSDVIIKQY
ncbi:MAG: DUF1080 domain-containing protein [Rikenellaceae bacterium]